MIIVCVFTLALAAAAVEGYINYGGNSYPSFQSSRTGQLGGRYTGTGYPSYNSVPNVKLASSYYNPYKSNVNSRYQTNAYYPRNTNIRYVSNPYQTNTNTQFNINPYRTNSNIQPTYPTYPSVSYVSISNSQFSGNTQQNPNQAASTSTSSSPQAVGNECPISDTRTIIISDYIKYGEAQMSPCIGSCYFQPNVVLDDITTLGYEKSDVVVLIVGPYSYPHTAFEVLQDATMLASLATTTNLYLATFPTRSGVTNTTVIEQTAAVNTLVRSAANTTSGAYLLDYQAFYNNYVSSTANKWTGIEMCNWLRGQIPTPVVTVAPATPLAVGTLTPF